MAEWLTLEILFETDDALAAYRSLPVVQAALDAVPDRQNGLLIYRGPGGASGAVLPRHPRPSPLAGSAALPDPTSEPVVDLDVADRAPSSVATAPGWP